MIQNSGIGLSKGIDIIKVEFCRNSRPIPDFRCLFNHRRKLYIPAGLAEAEKTFRPFWSLR